MLLRSFARPLAWPLLAALAFVPAVVAQATASQQAPAAARELHGRLEDLGGIKLLRVWGTPQERGYAHGVLLAKEVATAAIAEFTARFGGEEEKKLLDMARGAVDRLIEYPADVQTEIEALFQGLVDSKVDLAMPALGRSFDLTDLRIANALDVFGLMGCSGFTVWGEQADGGGVLTARNFDWPFTGVHLLDGTILLVEHHADGRAVCSVTWPGYVATVTGVSSDGVAVFLHVGSAKVSMTPEPSSWPTAIAARRILEELRPADPAAAIAKAKDLLGYTSPPAGFLTRVVLPKAPKDGSPAAVFETDTKKCVLADAPAGPCVTTNHFATRKDGRPASKDSLNRATKVQKGVDGCLADGDRKVSAAEAWTVLEGVQRGGHGFGTLHSLVFRHEPWCFELRVGTFGEKGCVPATVSTRRYVLTREQVFAKDAPRAK